VNNAYERTAADFHRRIDAIAAGVDTMAPGIEAAATQLFEALLNDRRILVCASGADAPLAAHVVRCLLRGTGSAPPLPAQVLTSDQADAADAPHWRDVRVLARDGDVLLCLDTDDAAPAAQRAAALAAERNLGCILLSELPASAQPNAVQITLPTSDRTLRQELALMAVHSLYGLLSALLVGET
jgi:phosphoheptose isomerase